MSTDRPPRPSVSEILSGGFSTPWDSPMSPAFPFSFRNAQIVSAVYRTDPDAMARLLPPPLEPVGDVVVIHVYRMNDTDWIGAYHECNVMFGARLGDLVGGYSPYLFLDAAVGLAQGREVHGQPKKYAEPRLAFAGDTVLAQLLRDGIEVVTATLPHKHNRADIAELSQFLDFATNINLKAIDHIDGRPAVRQLTARRLSQVTVHECWRGPCTVELRPHIQAPVYRLPVLEALEGFYWRADFTLVPGQIIYDYLDVDPGKT